MTSKAKPAGQAARKAGPSKGRGSGGAKAKSAPSGRPEAKAATPPARRHKAAKGGGTAPSVLIVMGVSGSGKTTIAALLAHRLGWAFEDGDWFHPKANVDKMAAGQPLTDADRWPWLEAIASWIDATRKAGHHAVVACSALKREYRAVLVRDHPDAARIVYLEGEQELIGARMRLRQGHFMPTSLLDSQFAALEPPDAEEHPITVSIAPHPREIVENIVKALETEIGHSVPPGP